MSAAEGVMEEGVVVEQKETLNDADIKTHRGCSGTHRRLCCKCCIGCTICSIVVAAVMIPVLILVIAPNVAQSMLDKTTVALPNSTLSACASNHAWAQNSAQLTIPGPLIGSATVHPYTQEVYTTMCGSDGGWACDDPQETLLGTYSSPEMSLSEGLNTKNFSVRMDLNDSTIVLTGILPLFFSMDPDMTPPKASLIMKARDVSVSVMGLKIGGLTMQSEVTCSGIAVLPSQDIPNWVCYPDDTNDTQHEPYSSMAFYMSCVAGHHNLSSQPATTTTSPVTTGQR